MIKPNIWDGLDFVQREFSVSKVIATALIGAGGIMVYRDIKIAYDASQAAGENLATVAAAGAFVKVFLVTGMVYCWNSRKALGAFGTVTSMIACAVAGILLHSYSLVSAMDFAFAGRDKVVTAQGQTIEDRQRLESRYAAASARVQASSGARSAGDIEIDLRKIEASMASAKARETSETESEDKHRKDVRCGDLCKAAAANRNAAIADQRTMVPRLEALSLELKGARQAEEARKEMASIDGDLAKLKTVGHKDPQAYSQATVLSGLGFKIDPKNAQHVENVGLVKPVLLALVNEFGATLAFLLSFAFWNSRNPEATTSKRPSGGIAMATRAPEAPPMEPVKLLPTPDLTKEQKALRALTQQIALTRGNTITVSGNELADHLAVPKSSMHAYLERWATQGKITLDRDGQRYVIGLPSRALVAARREMVTA